ncbi:DUF2793 domain-containing protein [Roseivivax sp. THAF30]|uniref:DUF2793 domain-containing protein n=1 Tax=Roseivivax sp. THAF30 TaxID=2587852 RepID=UPI0012689517|nr:DUF2793 domain-containing protein [Roseivivax sp. THAF30]QFT61365.1 hypothetical protein FIU91_00380 [Roseivivax sp. THAF30]
MFTSAALGLPFMAPSQAQKHVTFNEALRRLDLVVQLSVQGRDDAPPEAPSENTRFIVGASPSGAWIGHANDIAIFEPGGWTFTAPQQGWQAWIALEGRFVVWTGGTWQALEPELQNLPGLGINATSDANNPLIVAGPASLFNNVGGGHQVKINKAAPGETASLLFQTGWGGRAEMGTTGSDAFTIKVSADGGTWHDALVFDPATGHAGGAAVQSQPDDTTPGRLMRADWGYGPGTLLGQVAQASGKPTGAVLEAGVTYLRLACGTQIVWDTVALTRSDAATLSAHWTFPQMFAGPAFVSGSLDPGTANITPGLDALGAVTCTGGDGAGTTISLRRIAGQTDFAAVDTCTLRMTAIGRWF